MAKKREWLPWYRRKAYKGDLSEEDKRILDSFRLKEKHPATAYEELPEEVQNYIGRIELDLYDKKQEGLLVKALFITACSVFVLYRTYSDQSDYAVLGYLVGLGFILFAWWQYRRDWRRNAEEFLRDRDNALTQTDEGSRSGSLSTSSTSSASGKAMQNTGINGSSLVAAGKRHSGEIRSKGGRFYPQR